VAYPRFFLALPLLPFACWGIGWLEKSGMVETNLSSISTIAARNKPSGFPVSWLVCPRLPSDSVVDSFSSLGQFGLVVEEVEKVNPARRGWKSHDSPL
jgi:hypothetical protein